MPTAITLEIIRKRADFLRVQASARVGTETLVLHQCLNDALHPGSARIGYTVTKRCGGAVERNRIKRRLRAAVRQILPKKGKEGTDYVLIGKPATLEAPFEHLTRDLAYALYRHAKPKPRTETP